MPRPSRCALAGLVLPAAALLIGCGGAAPAPAVPHNETGVVGPHALAPNCFEIDRGALGDLKVLASGGKLAMIDGDRVPGLAKGKAWPGVAISEIRPGSLYHRMGLVDGDVVYAINGHSLFSAELVVSLLSDPTTLAALEDDPGPGSILGDLLSGSEFLSLAVIRDKERISINQVFAGAPATACAEHPALREKEAEQNTWTDAQWQAEAARAEAQGKEQEATEAARAEAQRVAQAAADSMDPAERELVVDGITMVTETTYELSSAVTSARMKQLLGDRRTGARLVPAMTDGKPDGIKLYAVRPGSLFAALGITNGDRLQIISGVTVTSADAVIDQLGRLPDEKSPSVTLLRRGKTVVITYTIK